LSERLATALATLNLTLRGAPAELKFRPDDPLDLLGSLEPIGTYDDLLPHAETVFIGGHPTRVIGLDDLIRIKRSIGRPKDRESLLHLEAIKRLRVARDEVAVEVADHDDAPSGLSATAFTTARSPATSSSFSAVTGDGPSAQPASNSATPKAGAHERSAMPPL